MRTVYLSLGSNLGDRLENLLTAVRLLTDDRVTRLKAVSSVWETLPQGKTDQPDFLNMAIAVETTIPSMKFLLDECLGVEYQMGRRRLERWGPRVIDIDICWADDLTVKNAALEVPHPRMAERAFVLVPLLELRLELQWQAWLAQLPDQGLRPHLSAMEFRARL